jgi:hypothetical protein
VALIKRHRFYLDFQMLTEFVIVLGLWITLGFLGFLLVILHYRKTESYRTAKGKERKAVYFQIFILSLIFGPIMLLSYLSDERRNWK